MKYCFYFFFLFNTTSAAWVKIHQPHLSIIYILYFQNASTSVFRSKFNLCALTRYLSRLSFSIYAGTYQFSSLFLSKDGGKDLANIFHPIIAQCSSQLITSFGWYKYSDQRYATTRTPLPLLIYIHSSVAAEVECRQDRDTKFEFGNELNWNCYE